MSNHADPDRAEFLSHLRQRAIAGVWDEFNYRGAERDADLLLRIARRSLDASNPNAESELAALGTAHEVKAYILRDRSSPAAEPHFDAAILIARRLDDPTAIVHLRNARITGLLNRGELNVAGRQVLDALRDTDGCDSAILRRAAAVLESAGAPELAHRLMLTGGVLRDANSPEQKADLTRLARLQTAIADTATPMSARRLRRCALEMLDIAEPALKASGQQVFRVTATATRGLVLHGAGDRSGAISALEEATEMCRTIAIRNRWTEELAWRLGGRAYVRVDPLSTMWARYWRSRLSDPRMAFEELARGWEYLLRRALALDEQSSPGGVEQPRPRGLQRLYSAARRNLVALGLWDVDGEIPIDLVAERLRLARNAVAHEISPELDFEVICHELEPVVRHLEAVLGAQGVL